jgi:hypothetical protein
MAQRSKPTTAGSKDTGVKLGRDPETGQFLEGHEGIGGRPPGSQNKFPTNYVISTSSLFRRSGRNPGHRHSNSRRFEANHVITPKSGRS